MTQQMTTPPNSLPPSPPPPPTDAASHSPSTLKLTRKAIRLRSLATRPVHVDPATRKADDPHIKKLRTYLGIVACDKKQVPTAQKDLIWEDIRAEFDIPEASYLRIKKKILQIMGEWWRQFKSDLTSRWAFVADKDSVDGIVCEKYEISKEKWTQFYQSRRDPSWEMCKRRHKSSENKTLSLTCCLKMANTKKTGQMTFEAAKEIVDKIDSLEEQASQGSFVAHGRQDVLTAGIGRCHDQTILWTSSKDLLHVFVHGSQRLGAADAKNKGPAGGVDHRKSCSTTNVVLQPDAVPISIGLALPLELEVGPSAARVSTKESYIDPSRNDPDTGDSEKCGLYVEENPPCPVAIGRLYEGLTTVHNIPFHHDQVKEVTDADAPIPIPTEEVQLVGQALNTFIVWPTHLVKHLLEQAYDSDKYASGECRCVWIPRATKKNSKRDVYLGAYLNGPNNYLKGIINRSILFFNKFASALALVGNINILIVQYTSMLVFSSALKGLDDTPQSKSKAVVRWIVVKCNRQKGSIECGYYVMHWMSTIILDSFKNNWETVIV
ncbi:hypothetical protein HKD37_09G024864 [Glycine soja]